MKKIAALAFACVFALTLLSCGRVDHDSLVSEIGEGKRDYIEKREAFTSSDVYDAAVSFVRESLDDLLSGCAPEISLEPGSLLGADLGDFSDLSENDSTRREFFSRADLSISVDYGYYGVDPERLALALAQYGISGRLMTENGGDCYRLDGKAEKVEFVPQPEA